MNGSENGGAPPRNPCMYENRNQRTFAFAGIFDEWHDKEGGFIITASIITTRPNIAVRMIADTMPVILQEKDVRLWVDPYFDKLETLRGMLLPSAPEELETFPVSNHVNRLKNDDEKCAEPFTLPPKQGELF